MPFGRPTKLTDDIIKAGYKYLYGYDAAGDDFPSIHGLSDEIDISVRTLQRWHKDEDNEFSYILTRLNTKQARVLLSQKNSPVAVPIRKLVLSNHGYFEKTATEISGPDGGSILHTDLSNTGDDELKRRLALKKEEYERSETE